MNKLSSFSKRLGEWAARAGPTSKRRKARLLVGEAETRRRLLAGCLAGGLAAACGPARANPILAMPLRRLVLLAWAARHVGVSTGRAVGIGLGRGMGLPAAAKAFSRTFAPALAAPAMVARAAAVPAKSGLTVSKILVYGGTAWAVWDLARLAGPHTSAWIENWIANKSRPVDVPGQEIAAARNMVRVVVQVANASPERVAAVFEVCVLPELALEGPNASDAVASAMRLPLGAGAIEPGRQETLAVDVDLSGVPPGRYILLPISRQADGDVAIQGLEFEPPALAVELN